MLSIVVAPSGLVHLEVHSHLSLLGATASVSELVARAAADGMAALALTDTNVLVGAVAFDRACRRAGIQPIIGMTVGVEPPEGSGRLPGHLVLLATGAEGYRSLCRLSSRLQGSPARRALLRAGASLDLLQRYAEGLICLTGGRRGWVDRLLASGNERTALRYAGRLAGIYGEGSTYLALELLHPGGPARAQATLEIAGRLGLASVAVQPVFCLEADERSRLRLLAAIDHSCSLEEVPAAVLPDEGDPRIPLHWLAPTDMEAAYADFPGALAMTGAVAARCGPALPDGRPIWPIPAMTDERAPEQVLSELAHEGLVARYGRSIEAAVTARLDRELAVINRHGYAPLFLIVADIARFARENDIPISTRGSVANSLVAYCTGITSVDPVAHDLLFERFLSPARSDPPDIDVDLCSLRRDEVLDYVRRRYGADRVALVGTVSTMRPKSAVRETAKAVGLDEAETNRLLAHIPRGWHPDSRRRSRWSAGEVLEQLADARLRRVVEAAEGIVGQPHHLSVHPGGVVITPTALTDTVPLQWAPKGFLITQFDHTDVEALGLAKIDLLGIRALTVLAAAANLVRRHHDPAFRLEGIALDDPATQVLLRSGATIGVFQCESAGAQATLRKLQACTVRDLAVANAFFKPGPARGGMAEAFVRRYRGEEVVSFLHPALEPILGPTFGVLIFQEQILRVAREIAGLSWAQADHLRRGMSKFRPDEMDELRADFVAGCRRPGPAGPGLSAAQAASLWEQVSAFAGYGFNQGHATAYADVSFRSAYLKAHWPAAFLCARLAYWGGYHHPAVYMAEAVRLGIAVRPPHVNHSEGRFTLAYDAVGDKERPVLWMGLGQVRDLRRTAIREMVRERQRRRFDGLSDLLRRVSLQAKEVDHLIRCGALDGLEQSRAELLVEAQQVARTGGGLQMLLPFDRPPVAAETAGDRLAWERHLLGLPVSVHPLEWVGVRPPDRVPLRALPDLAGRPISTAGARLPGWTGGDGFFLGDGDTLVLVRQPKGEPAPGPWEPVGVSGRWVCDSWGSCWLQAQRIEAL
jgi:DNA polymerase III subunit alpha